MNLETEIRDSGIIYKCLPGQHDDLGIFCAMLAWRRATRTCACGWVRGYRSNAIDDAAVKRWRMP
jgi:hypothetical protein